MAPGLLLAGTWNSVKAFKIVRARETLEETGLVLGTITMGPVTNDIFIAEEKHYITIFMIGEYIGGEPQLLEPEKCTEWRWFAFDALSSPLFLPVSNMLAHGVTLHALSHILNK